MEYHTGPELPGGARLDPSCYADPNGFVFHCDGTIYRFVREHAAGFYRNLLIEHVVDELVASNGLVPTEIVEAMPGFPAGLFLQHESIWPITYPTEWCPSMLQDASLLTLDLSSALGAHGLMLQDAYPWNVLFRGSEPIHVDFTSIVAAHPQLIWPAWDQFEAFFARPLALASIGKGRIARALLFDNLRGVSSAELTRHATGRYKIRHPLLSVRRSVEALVQRSRVLRAIAQRALKAPRPPVETAVRLRFFRQLRRVVSHLRFPVPDGWAGYYDSFSGTVDLATKLRSVNTVLQRRRPSTVLDLGANTGEFSRMAAREGARVVAVDDSEACMERLYAAARAERLPITPVVADVLCPTPAFGFLSEQYPALATRARCEVVLALGLMHHLHIAGRQPFERLAKLLRRMTSRYLIFEFVDRTDSNIQLIESVRTIDYTFESVRDALAFEFGPCEILPSDRDSRKLMVFGCV